jgi:hypothetical protein
VDKRKQGALGRGAAQRVGDEQAWAYHGKVGMGEGYTFEQSSWKNIKSAELTPQTFRLQKFEK